MCVYGGCARVGQSSASRWKDQPAGHHHQSERDGRAVHIGVVVVRDNCQQQLCTSWQESDQRRLLGRGGLTSEVSRQGSRGAWPAWRGGGGGGGTLQLVTASKCSRAAGRSSSSGISGLAGTGPTNPGAHQLGTKSTGDWWWPSDPWCSQSDNPVEQQVWRERASGAM